MLAEKVLRKHVAIIHAYSLMSVLQRKIVNVLLYEAIQAKNNSTDQNSVAVECLMPFSKLVTAVNFNSNNTQYLKEAIDELASLKIEWNLLKDKAPIDISFLNLRILHGSPTFYQNGKFNFSFHKFMFDLVGNPSIYGTIDMGIQSRFESKYGHSLYENSTRFVNLQKSKIIQLDTFRNLLGVNESKYLSMSELTRNVIKPSLEEVNDRAGFIVNIQNVRVGRKVTGFEISVESKNKIFPISKKTENQKQDKILEIIQQSFGKISETVLDNVLKSYTEEYILEKISYTKQHAKKEKSEFYPVAYFMSALRDDYKPNDQCVEEKKEQKVSSSHHNVWCEKLHVLQSDAVHWQRQLKYAQASKNLSLSENCKKVLLQCEERLQKHLLEQSKYRVVGEVG